LEVLRNGVEMDQLKLFSSSSSSSSPASSSETAQHYYTFGRMPGAVTFVLDNPTISRVHAVLQFKKEDGTLHVQDLGSTHGTFVNKQRT
jgi:pSer/pThr/pTyr-binding forkhead associated (FHA) protein